jgi:hypothetical protein
VSRSRCQRSRVAGVTKNVAQRWRGSSRDRAARHCAVGGFEVQTADLTAEHRDLVAEHENFHVLGPIAAHALGHQLQDLAEHHVPERKDHALSMTAKPQQASDKAARQQA